MEPNDEGQTAAEQAPADLVKHQAPKFVDRGFPGDNAFTRLPTTLAHLTPTERDDQK